MALSPAKRAQLMERLRIQRAAREFCSPEARAARAAELAAGRAPLAKFAPCIAEQ